MVYEFGMELSMASPLLNFWPMESELWKSNHAAYFSSLPAQLSIAEQMLGGEEFFGGRGPHHGDFVFFHILTACLLLQPRCLAAPFPRLAALVDRIAALARDKEVIVSRGELVEIGGAFRMPDVMASAGAHMVEVGTTNRTHEKDYAEAIDENTAALMKVHCSNYAITGFTKAVSDADVARIAHDSSLPMIVDLGSGTLIDMRDWGLPYEVTVRETVESGADIVTFSGDKLLGGPQAGIIVGKRELIAQIKKNPLKRALRVGKITLAALEPTLRLYLNPEKLAQELTTLRLFTRKAADMQAQAGQLQPLLQQALGQDYVVETAAMNSQIGSGALPVENLPSFGLRIYPASGKQAGRQLTRLEARFRALPRPVIGRLHDDALWLDLRCLENPAQALFAAQLPLLA
jgi:L-seryl-tRNA(Ser) seleniumtransferase